MWLRDNSCNKVLRFKNYKVSQLSVNVPTRLILLINIKIILCNMVFFFHFQNDIWDWNERLIKMAIKVKEHLSRNHSNIYINCWITIRIVDGSFKHRTIKFWIKMKSVAKSICLPSSQEGPDQTSFKLKVIYPWHLYGSLRMRTLFFFKL